MAGTPGLDAGAAVGPYLNGNLPPLGPTSEMTVLEYYKGININLPMHVMPYPGTNKLICVAKEGRIFTFDDAPNAVAPVAAPDVFLDFSAKTFTNSDCGMTWLVFHPQFGQPGKNFVYVTYKWKPPVESGVVAAGNGSEAYWRLVRLTVITDGNGKPIADPASEQILIQQYDRQQFHDSGCMTFGPDGYLYVGIGDEGGANDQYNVGQKIDERLFSGILRIDVDQKPGNHAPLRQPVQLAMPMGWPDSYTANYSIPADNPFNNPAGTALEEFYAIGLRQPYRFSYDPVSQLMWLAESGQDSREELDIVQAGDNYGWPFREGMISRPTGPQPPTVPNPIIGNLKDPIWDASHATDACTVGGFVYRAAAFPQLIGKYLTVDNVTGHIRAHSYDGTVATNDLLTDMPSGSVYSGTSTIGWDTAGEPIFVKINGTGTRGSFYKLGIAPPASTRSVWYRFEDQDATNTTGYVSDNPENAVTNSLVGGVAAVAYDNESNLSGNVFYNAGSGQNPTGFTNSHGVTMASGDANGWPGNRQGDLTTQYKLGVINDFTAEVSFKPGAGSLAGGYQCFLGLDGLGGTTPPADGEDGPALQTFRLMRWGRDDAGAVPGLDLHNGDLFLNIRTLNPATNQWTTVPMKVLPRESFLADEWYHLAIVGDVAAGTLTVYRFSGGSYSQLGQVTGYVGNLQSNFWSIGRGAFGGNPADWVVNTDFDEVKITNQALDTSEFLYGAAPVVPDIPPVEPPFLLSQTGAFSDTPNMVPAQGVLPYDVNAPLWSDRAHKLRWIVVPNDGIHDSPSEKIQFKPEGSWKFPVGTVFIKHFELPVDDANPTVYRRLETRFYVMPETGEPYGFTYKWREDNSDAELMPAGLDENIDIATNGGGTRQETWTYPSSSDCRFCHNSNADHILGVKPWHLNGDVTYPETGRTANQLETLGAIGIFDNAFQPNLVPWMLKSRHVQDSAASLTERVRSYLDSNCSQCHQPDGVRAFFDARMTTPLENQGIIYGELENSDGDPANRVILPGDPNRSIMLRRLSSVGAIKMPPIAKHIVDQPAIDLMTAWIQTLGTGPLVTLSGPATTTGPFQVAVHFDQEVTGLTASDFSILGGTASGLTGSGQDYVLTVAITNVDRVDVLLPAATAQNAGGAGNYASAIYSQTVVDGNQADPAGLLAWYHLDELSGTVAADSSVDGIQNNGTLAGSSLPVWNTGSFDGGLGFNTNGHVSIANPIGNDFSFSFWLKTTQVFPRVTPAYAGAVIFYSDSPGSAADFVIAGTRSTGGTNRITMMTGNPTAAETNTHGTSSVNNGQWNHVVVTREKASGQVKIYVNGNLERTATGTTFTLNSNPAISIGGTPGAAANSFNGSLDEIQIYDRVLTQTEVTELGSGPPEVTPTIIPASDAYDDWTKAWFPGIYHLQGLKTAPGDFDLDGTTNFGEFAFGTNPQTHDFITVPISHNAPGGPVMLSFNALKDRSGAGYQVLVSDNMNAWQDATANISATSTTDIPGTAYEVVNVTYTPPVGTNGKQFFRIQAKQK